MCVIAENGQRFLGIAVLRLYIGENENGFDVNGAPLRWCGLAGVELGSYYVMCPVDPSTVIDVGDPLYLDTDDTKPAYAEADGGTKANEETFHGNFHGRPEAPVATQGVCYGVSVLAYARVEGESLLEGRTVTDWNGAAPTEDDVIIDGNIYRRELRLGGGRW